VKDDYYAAGPSRAQVLCRLGDKTMIRNFTIITTEEYCW